MNPPIPVRCLLNFNPRSREGSDWVFCSFPAQLNHFNPRSREGSDAFRLVVICFLSFQSTLPRGERLLLVELHACVEFYFNPRSREGSDESRDRDVSGLLLFQSTLPRGERRPSVCCLLRFSRYFNPRSREGSDCKNTQTTNIISVYFYLYYIIFVSLATNTAYITITKPSKCRCESPYTFC